MRTIKAVLMERDGYSSDQADDLIDAAKTAFNQYIDDEEHELAENVCVEFFNIHDLEYVFELMD